MNFLFENYRTTFFHTRSYSPYTPNYMDFSVNFLRMFSLQFAALGEEKEPNMVYI